MRSENVESISDMKAKLDAEDKRATDSAMPEEEHLMQFPTVHLNNKSVTQDRLSGGPCGREM